MGTGRFIATKITRITEKGRRGKVKRTKSKVRSGFGKQGSA